MKAWFWRVVGKVWRWWYDKFSLNGNGRVMSTMEYWAKLKELWPGIKISSPDRSLVVLPLAEMEKPIRAFPYWLYKFVAELFDCDDYALAMHAHMRIHRLRQYILGKISSTEVFPSAFGQIWGAEMMGVRSPHAVNVMICEEGVFVIEPQTGKIMKADPERDKAWEIRF